MTREVTVELTGQAWGDVGRSVDASYVAAISTPDSETASKALDLVDQRWAERRASSVGGGLLVLLDYEFGVRLAGLPRTRDLPDRETGVRIFRLDKKSTPACEAGLEAESASRALNTTAEPEVRTSLDRSRYISRVDSIRASIRNGDYYQANLCRMFRIDRPTDPQTIRERLEATTSAPWSAYLRWPGGALVSFSPECFLEGSLGGVIKTRPIKGTRPRSSDPRQDEALGAELLASPKDRAELTMIVDLERNDLGRVCRPGTVTRTAEPRLQKFREVWHLVAEVQGEFAEARGWADAMRASFPGGSISGAPKRAVLADLETLEPWPRGAFTGTLCWLGDDGTFRSSLLIRTLEWVGDRAYLGAGGGITWDSVAEDEWDEANHKARPFAKAMGFEPESVRC